MALAYLNKNSTSAAAANWSDTTGFVNNAELVLGDSDGISVTEDVGYAGLATGVESFEVLPSYNGDAGQAGTPFVFDADASADAFVRHGGSRRLYYSAAGVSGVCNFLYQVGMGSVYLEGGTVTDARIRSGGFFANENTVLTNVTIWGGRGTIENNATGFTAYVQKGGSFVVRRDGTITVEGGSLTLDIPDDSPTVDLVIRQGARVKVVQGNVIANVRNDGVLDISASKRPITLGATTHTQGPFASLIRGSLAHTITEPEYLAGSRQDTPIGPDI